MCSYSILLFIGYSGIPEEAKHQGRTRRSVFDLFTTDLIVDIADIIVLVVDGITSLRDQQRIAALEEQVQDEGRGQSLIVVHNFKGSTDSADYRRLWKVPSPST